MKQASKLLYSIGFVFNIIDLVFLSIFIILFGVALGDDALIEQAATDTNYSQTVVFQFLLVFVIVTSIFFAVHFVILFLVISARKNLINKTGRMSPHVLLLLLGIFDLNLFYIIGGVLGLGAASNDNNEDDD